MQLDIFAAPVEVVVIQPTRDVVYRGARAEGIPRHAHVPSHRPKALLSDEEWLRVLVVAEVQIRWKSWTCPHPLPLDSKPEDCVGGGKDFWYDGKGVALGRWEGDTRYAPWPALLRGLREQREAEPHIADARDLAAAYHATDQYDRFYIRDGGSVPGNPEWRERVSVPHFAHLRETIAQLGGDPDFLATHLQAEGVVKS